MKPPLTPEELKRILTDHQKWFDTKGEKGTQASLRNANLQGANLVDAKLQGANLHGTDLQGANLGDAKILQWD